MSWDGPRRRERAPSREHVTPLTEKPEEPARRAAQHVQKARVRWEMGKAWSVTVPLPVWEEYAREARLTGCSITECLDAAIRRDYERRRGTIESLETLDQNVRAFHAAATQLLTEARLVVERVGPLQEIGMRLARIEGDDEQGRPVKEPAGFVMLTPDRGFPPGKRLPAGRFTRIRDEDRVAHGQVAYHVI